jgi:hypothetical protein
MRTEQDKDRADKIAAYVFVAGVAVALVSFAVMAVTGSLQPGVRVFITALWIIFATWNGVIFYTGHFTWKGGPTFSREESPRMFYVSAVFFTIGSMSIASFLLWAAYFTR